MIKGLTSVIIPKTKYEDISECLLSIQASTIKNVETIVVDEGLERSKQRNIGIDRAKGEFLLFLDADQYIATNLIEDCINKIVNNEGRYNYNSMYIPETIVTSGWFGRLRDWERQFYTGTEIDCVRFVRSECCPYFDETMSGPEDSDWDKRIEGKKGISESCLFHRDNIGVIKYFKKKIYYTKSMARYAEKWPTAKVLNFKYRCWTVFTEHGKWKELLRHPINALAVYLVIFVRGIIYICGKK